ncbi:MAG: GNAT family N-acetyltransferase [Polyangiaceae bacterium]
MSSLEVRPAQKTDVPALAALMVEFYGESSFPLRPEAAARAFTHLIDSPDRGQVWLLVAGGAPAGFVVLTVSFSMEYGALRGFIDDFFITPAHRNKGLGKLALAAVKHACDSRDVRALLVEVAPDNGVAQRVYRGAGLDDTGHTLLSLRLGTPLHEQ